ncbi:hypothetical protein PC129_g20901 [Phytophthora cactorum]|uniref:DUSP domain-containing protein n=2 Tax=Phytophthora cactorum TaxID=29920 RepID=A0A329RLY3_9STRA|nr:Peptidase C19, ubiquitin-specific peptidase, DUSP domain [Phytophthora cactorum]KAG2773286.1 hypothetical protein Pcac1_g15918 [Phytophthora cactorum]KAG2797686.1 hypothetical protein PC111_g21181 [Phytophthora cactorum]KAG2797794.1 hypothetical protein PC112_g21629 [Phytophthora cactorum]KAG2827822.1 hypothetical protein PC113_g21556 [Phytophthora cactorum]
MATSARWLLSGSRHAVVDVEVPPGALGIMLDCDDLDRPVLEGFAQVSPSEPQQRGAVELSGRVPVGSVLVGVNEHDFMKMDLSFQEVGDVLRETSHLPRTLKFHVPLAEENKVPLSQQFAPRRGPPPREEEDDDEEEEESDDEVQAKPKTVASQPLETQDSSLPFNQQYAPRRGPPPREEEEDNERDSSSAEESFQEIQMSSAQDQGSDESTSWTLTGSNLDESSNTPLASSVSSTSPEKENIEETRQISPETALPKQPQPSPEKPKRLSLEIDSASMSLPKELSFGTMAKLAETRHFDSDDSSDSDDDESFDAVQAKAPSAKTGSSDNPEEPPPEKPSSVPLSMASNVSSGTIAASLMVQSNQFDRDDSVEDEDAEYVTAVAPPGPLGLNLDGGVLDRAVVMGFVRLNDGSKGALERNGDIVPGSVIVRINGEDVSHASLKEVGVKLSELSQQPRTLVFRLPPKAQQEEHRSSMQPSAIHSATMPQFEEDPDKRRKFELALIMHYDKQVLSRRDCWFCIDAKWMARWIDFVCRGGPEPGPITNETLLHENWRKMLAHDAPGRPDTAREGMVLLKDYRVVVPMVWCLFAELHGLGEAPLLARYLMDIHAEALSDGEVSKVLEVPRPKAAVLANNLLDKCLVRPSRKR